MKAEIQYGLEGSFKLDLYSGGKLVDSTDWFSNFITATGLVYPSIYTFAQCFRFLTIGSSNSPNDAGSQNPNVGDYHTMDGTDTTGCYSPYYTYNTSVGLQTGAWMGWPFYSTNANSSSCITTAGTNGPRFFRSWSVPNGPNNVTMNQAGGGLNIAELAVSPSSGGDPTGCFAFSRIVRSLVIPNGYKGIISYQLQMNLLNSTGYTLFPPGTFNTGGADISEDADLISGWANLSGYYRQVWHGLDCIDASGATFFWNLGDGMEPSTQNLNNCVFYLSPDNSQFDVNNVVGGAQSNVTAAYNSDGLMQYLSSASVSSSFSALNFYPNTYPSPPDSTFYGLPYGPGINAPGGSNPNLTVINVNNTYVSIPNSIRLGNNVGGLPDPMIDNYTLSNDGLGNHPPDTVSYQTSQSVTGYTISYATPGVLGYNFGRFPAPVINKALFSSNLIQLPWNTGAQNGPCGRNKSISRVATFPPPISLGYNSRFGSLVYAFQDLGAPTIGDVTYWPMIDILFMDSSGRSMMQHYRLIDNIWLTQRGSGIVDAYVTLSGNGVNSDNIQRIYSRQTFQGPYVGPKGYDPSAPAYIDSTTNGNTVGYLSSGAYPTSTTSGNSQVNNPPNTTGGFGSGWGMVYGIITDDTYWGSGYYDLGLADHSLTATGLPSQTGQVFWPYCLPGNQINVIFTGVKFYHPSIGVIQDSGNWFINNRQMPQSVGFQDVDATRLTTVLGSTFSGNPALFNQSPTVPLNATSSGYYLTTVRYNYHLLGGTADNNSFITLASGNFANAITVTGFLSTLAQGYGIIPAGQVTGTACVSVPIYTGINATNLSGTILSPVRVTGFFQNVNDRSYGNIGWNGSRGFLGTGFNYPFFVSGYYNSVPPVPLYLTYVFNSGSSLVGHSYLNTIVTPTAFCQPSGVPNHYENINGTGWRLLPNYGQSNNTGGNGLSNGVNIYPPVVGGQLPATSLDNGLQLYFYINWSAPCGQAINCNNPV